MGAQKSDCWCLVGLFGLSWKQLNSKSSENRWLCWLMDHLLFHPCSWSLGSECTYATPLSPHPVATTTRVLGMVIFRWFSFPRLQAKACQGCWRSVYLWVVTDFKVLPVWKAMKSRWFIHAQLWSSLSLFTRIYMIMLARLVKCTVSKFRCPFLKDSIHSIEGKVHRWRGILRHWPCRTPTRTTFALDANCWIRDDRKLLIKSINKASCSSIRLMSLTERAGRLVHFCILVFLGLLSHRYVGLCHQITSPRNHN